MSQRPSFIILSATSLFVVVVFWTAMEAQAFPAFQREFASRYLAKGSKLNATYGERSTCNVCHIGGSADREHRNEYGQALARRLNRADAEALSGENRRLDPAAASASAKRIEAAFEAVEKLPSGVRDVTFGELIRDGKLPMSPATLPPREAAR